MAFLNHTAAQRDPLATLLAPEPLALDTPAARHALRAGLLEARREALCTAEHLIQLGRPLLVVVIGVSFVHIFDTIAAIKPAAVPALLLPAWLYHATAAALTLTIDAAALFSVAVSGAVALAGHGRRWNAGLMFFLATTFLLNAAFVVAYAPSLPPAVRAAVRAALELSFAVLIPATIPIALAALEHALGRLRATRLHLLVEITAMDELQGAAHTSHNASERVSGHAHETTPLAPLEDFERPIGGRPALFGVEDVLELAAQDGTVSRTALLETLGCSSTTADRLLSEAQTAGLIMRVGRGLYQRSDLLVAESASA